MQRKKTVSLMYCFLNIKTRWGVRTSLLERPSVDVLVEVDGVLPSNDVLESGSSLAGLGSLEKKRENERLAPRFLMDKLTTSQPCPLFLHHCLANKPLSFNPPNEPLPTKLSSFAILLPFFHSPSKPILPRCFRIDVGRDGRLLDRVENNG